MQRTVMTKILQVTRILFKVGFQCLAIKNLLLDFLYTRFLDGGFGDTTQCILHSVAECLDLSAVVSPWMDLHATAFLIFHNLFPHLFVVLARGTAQSLLLAKFTPWHDKAQRRTSVTCACGATDAVGISARRRGQIKVDNTSDCHKINTTRHVELLAPLR